MPGTLVKNWDAHVADAEEVARGDGFKALRDRIVELACPAPGMTAVDVGAGTGLLSLALAEKGAAVWAVDVSPAMCEYLRCKAASAQLRSIDTVVSSAVSLPLVDSCADVVVSNYCFHHLRDADKHRALSEAHRVLRPGGQLIVGDMMFSLGVLQPRDRRVLADKVKAMVRKGPAGVHRLLKNGARVASGRWEQPAPAQWWREALPLAGFVDVTVEELVHEGGLATARRP